MECKYDKNRIINMLESNPSVEEKREIMEHVENCAQCKKLYDSFYLLGEYYEKSDLKLSQKCSNYIRNSINKDLYNEKKFSRSAVSFIYQNLKAIKTSAALAALFIVIFAGVLYRDNISKLVVSSDIYKFFAGLSDKNSIDIPGVTPGQDEIQGATNEYLDESKYITSDNDFLSMIEGNDRLLIRANDNYLYCTNTNSLKILESEEVYFRDYQCFLSDDGNIVYYNTNVHADAGKLMYYDIKNNTYGDLLEEMNIEIPGHVGLISYKSDKIIILVVEYNDNSSGIETDTLIEIDLKERKHKTIKLPFTPFGAWVCNGLCYFGDNIGILCSYKELEGSNQLLVILDKDGNILEEIPMHEDNLMRCNISSSPDGSKFTYQTGSNPTDLYLYDLKDRSKKMIFPPESPENKEMCIMSMWGKESKNLYYVTYRTSEGSGDEYRLHVVKPAAEGSRYVTETPTENGSDPVKKLPENFTIE